MINIQHIMIRKKNETQFKMIRPLLTRFLFSSFNKKDEIKEKKFREQNQKQII